MAVLMPDEKVKLQKREIRRPALITGYGYEIDLGECHFTLLPETPENVRKIYGREIERGKP
jgi:hypothetical protein